MKKIMVKIDGEWSEFRTRDAETYNRRLDGLSLIGVYDGIQDIKLVDEPEEECVVNRLGFKPKQKIEKLPEVFIHDKKTGVWEVNQLKFPLEHEYGDNVEFTIILGEIDYINKE